MYGGALPRSRVWSRASQFLLLTSKGKIEQPLCSSLKYGTCCVFLQRNFAEYVRWLTPYSLATLRGKRIFVGDHGRRGNFFH